MLKKILLLLSLMPVNVINSYIQEPTFSKKHFFGGTLSAISALTMIGSFLPEDEVPKNDVWSTRAIVACIGASGLHLLNDYKKQYYKIKYRTNKQVILDAEKDYDEVNRSNLKPLQKVRLINDDLEEKNIRRLKKEIVSNIVFNVLTANPKLKYPLNYFLNCNDKLIKILNKHMEWLKNIEEAKLIKTKILTLLTELNFISLAIKESNKYSTEKMTMKIEELEEISRLNYIVYY